MVRPGSSTQVETTADHHSNGIQEPDGETPLTADQENRQEQGRDREQGKGKGIRNQNAIQTMMVQAAHPGRTPVRSEAKASPTKARRASGLTAHWT